MLNCRVRRTGFPGYTTMSDYSEPALRLLIPLLRQRRPVLMVGAGSSMFVGYKSWDGLVDSLAMNLIPPLARTEGVPVSEFAQIVRQQFITDHRLDDYHNLLESLCSPGKTKQYDQMHLSLVQLGCSGIATTNYDPVLEMAITKAFESENGPFHCEQIDMCGPRPHLVWEFIQALAEKREPRLVLHLHGYFRNPAGIILTESDYQTRYRLEPQLDGHGNPVDIALRTLHSHVLYSLLIQYPFFFIGFSLSDKFFMHVLSIVQNDFQLGTTPKHFATMPFKNEKQRQDIEARLRRQGVAPLFYYVQPGRDGEPEDHSALKTLILELAEAAGGQRVDTSRGVPPRDWRNISIDMMER
jgi:SIR2-like domain